MMPEVTITVKTEDNEESLEIYLLDTKERLNQSLPPVADLIDAIEEALVSEYFLYDILKTTRL